MATGKTWKGPYWQAWMRRMWIGEIGRGTARISRHGMADAGWRGASGSGRDCSGRHGEFRCDVTGTGQAEMARRGRHGKAS